MKGDKSLVGGGYLLQEDFFWCGDEQNFGLSVDSHSQLVGGWGSFPSRGNPDL